MPAAQAAEPSPYGSAAESYWEAGWRGILPLPLRDKKLAIKGWSGRHGITPSWADIQSWIDDGPHNICLRMPDNLLGLDVDAYDGKTGLQTFAAAEERWGKLPPTWRTTSRDDGVSGIRLYIIPPGLKWPGQLPGGGVELCHLAHRYVVAPPSVHPEGRRYRWINPDGMDTFAVPSPDELPRLPINWIMNLSLGVYVEEPLSADMTKVEIAAWLSERPGFGGEPCRIMARYLESALTSMTSGSRHDTALKAFLQLVRFAASGHTGLGQAVRKIRSAFVDAVVGDKSRSNDEAGFEVEKMLASAVAKVAGAPDEYASVVDPCNMMGAALAKAHAEPPTTYAPGGMLSVRQNPAQQAVLDSPSPSPFSKLLAAEQGTNEALAEAPAPAIDLFTVTEPEPVVVERTSWAPADMDLALSGKFAEGPPSVLARADGKFLLYAHRINGLVGPSESGKSWVALEACRQVLAAGHRVLILDFEDSPAGIVGRLVSLSIEPDVLRQRLAYVGPSEPLASVQMADLMVALSVIGEDDLIVLDGFNAAMTLQGLELMSNRDVTVFYQQLLRVLVATRACVVYVDHTPKNDAEGDSRGGIGAQAKRAMTTGTILRCDIKTPFGRDQTGYIAILADKDRSGHVRAVSPGRKVGTAKLDSVTDDNGVNRVTLLIELSAPPETVHTESGADYSRPTFLMRRVSDYLATHPGASGRAVREDVNGREKFVSLALSALVIEGYVEVATGPRNATLHTLVKPYLEELDDPEKRVVPSGAPVVPGTGQKTTPLVPQNPGTKSPGYGHQSSSGSPLEDVSGAGAPLMFEDSGDDV
jgi:hypothetical protein